MKVFHRLTGGVGDVLSEQFIPVSQNKPNDRGVCLSRMIRDWRAGKFEACGVAYESGRPIEGVYDVFAAMGLRSLDPGDLKGWTDSTDLSDAPGEMPPELLSVPTVRPRLPVPRDFILLNTSTGDYDRLLYDAGVYRAVKSAHKSTPIITVGTGETRIPTDIDLTGAATLPNVAWLAQRARLVVTAVTFHRCWAAIYNTPVFEILPADAESCTWERTWEEYRIGRYGIGQLNRIYSWPDQQAEFTEALRTIPAR